MRRLRQLGILLLLSCCLLSLPVTAVQAAGGGGSSMPSTAPQIDPVKKYKQGVKYLKAQQYKKAAKAFKSVLSVSRKHANSHYLLGVAYIGSEKFSKARKSLLRALKYEPNMAEAMGHLAYVYNSMGKAEKAEAQKQVLLELQKKCGDCADKGVILDALAAANSGVSAALDFNLVPFMDIHSGDLAYIEAVGLINRGDYTLALTLLENAARVFGPHPDILTYQGFANRKMNQRDQAYGFYQAALTVAPDHRGANEYLGEYFVEINDLPAAKAQLAILQEICNFGCEEAQELGRWIVAAES